MRVVIAPDSFKESMSARQAGEAITRGIHRVWPQADCLVVPMSDGGEGFTESIAEGLDATIHEVTVHDALGRKTSGQVALAYKTQVDGKVLPTAVLEMASASGLADIAPDDRNPLRASSRGVGELLLFALDSLVKEDGKEASNADFPQARIIVGLGGSATNDAGTGMLSVLGAQFLDEKHQPVEAIPENFHEIVSCDVSKLDSRLKYVRVEVANDVTNPLCGEQGASAVFGPQKGADEATVEELDSALRHLCEVAQQCVPELSPAEKAEQPGAGAAGGLGWAFATFLDAHFEAGIDLVARMVDLEAKISGSSEEDQEIATLVITGEGSIDAQTLNGKAPAGVANRAQKYGVPCLVLAGKVHADADVLYDHGVSAMLPIVQGAESLEHALTYGESNIERTASSAIRLISLSL